MKKEHIELYGDKMLKKYGLFKVMEKVLFHPNKKFSIRGLARELDISPMSCREYLNYMKENKMLSCELIGRTSQYKVIIDSPLVKEWKRVLFLNIFIKTGVVDYFLDYYGKEKIDSILLYGSMVKGTADEKSDIDILIILRNIKKKKPILLKFEGELKREIMPISFTFFEWKQKAKKEKAFYDEVILNSIVLYGEKPVVL
ncbi:MAG: nucleotidyltransferase domain-containing protein [Candidatus Micrarchaeia archaeon]